VGSEADIAMDPDMGINGLWAPEDHGAPKPLEVARAAVAAAQAKVESRGGRSGMAGKTAGGTGTEKQ
jgi:hypothetical protein